ncbi:hypothetical protein ACFSTC_22265 [Nonomuraea ferruginea]
MNDKMYIHEFIDVTGHNRARYMHHMTANFSPIAQEERDQLCYGVWGVVGSTAWWPGVVNIWEEDGWDGLASSFRHELGHPSLQDPKLAAWWAAAAEMRSGGVDRLLLPAPWTRTIEELCADGVRGEVYAHERITVPPGDAADFLERVRDQAVPHYGRFGWDLARRLAHRARRRLRVLPALGRAGLRAVGRLRGRERRRPGRRMAGRPGSATRPGRSSASSWSTPRCPPMRIGRQPARSDRTEDWSE